jgi:hypothetical protein
MTNTNIILDSNTKVLDPLSEAKNINPPFAVKLKLSHHSPTQCLMPDGPYVYRYVICDQTTRRLFEGNSQMAAGVAVNNALQWHYADILWKLSPANKLTPTNHIKLKKDFAIRAAIEEFKQYKPVNDKDQAKKDHYLETLPVTIENAFQAIGKLGKVEPVTCENYVTIPGDSLSLSLAIIGRSDFEFGNFGIKSFPADASKTSSPSSAGSFLLELKTSWSRPGKAKKDGSLSFVSSKAPTLPSQSHLIQVAFYAAAYDYKIPIKLLYVSEQDTALFDSSNCEWLTVEGLKKNFKYILNVARRRERMFARYQDLSIAEIKKSLIADVDPQFDHPFYWNIGREFVNQAKELWNV